MGQKGDKYTNEAQLSVELLLEKLSSVEGLTSKKMFGGHGIFHDGRMFGIVDSKGQAYLKSNDETAPKFLELGSIQHGKMPYHSVPDEILNSTAGLLDLAKTSIEISK
ncbi:MAG: TfoX/Sxy family protein [Cyclobacteriaceae bacterium]